MLNEQLVDRLPDTLACCLTSLPVVAIERGLKNAGLTIEDIARLGINEAFSAVTEIAVKELCADCIPVNC